ncbi:MAG TPA: hypothetical protein VHV82_04090 [Sporichthyaceae bacterium]|nr:hypothetical protein [Sporichthyaceae bacterium]
MNFNSGGSGRNSWKLSVGARAASARVTVSERPRILVSRIWFVIARAKAAMPGGEVRIYPTAGANWGPGEYTATVTRDGKDDHRRAVKPGRYQLRVAVTDTTTHHVVTCTDGTRGVERLSGSGGTAGLGNFTLDQQTSPDTQSARAGP